MASITPAPERNLGRTGQHAESARPQGSRASLSVGQRGWGPPAKTTGRDGSRVPLPWAGAEPPFGFSPAGAGAEPWLPSPRRGATSPSRRRPAAPPRCWSCTGPLDGELLPPDGAVWLRSRPRDGG